MAFYFEVNLFLSFLMLLGRLFFTVLVLLVPDYIRGAALAPITVSP